MELENTVLYDGQEYKPGDAIPDLGSLMCVSISEGGLRNYEGNSSDYTKLPLYAPIGSSFLATYGSNKGDYYKRTGEGWTKLN